MDSVVVVLGLRCPEACEVFPDQGSNWCSPALPGGFLATGPPRKPHFLMLNIIVGLVISWTSCVCARFYPYSERAPWSLGELDLGTEQ